MVARSRSAVLRRAGSFLSLLVFEVAAVAALTRLGSIPELRIPWHSLSPWLLSSPVEDVLAAVLRNIALLIAWWLLGSNLLYLLASLTRVPSAIRAVRWLTLPVVRRATDHALALTLATSLMGAGTGTAVAAAPVAVMAPQRSGPVAAEQQTTQSTQSQPSYVPRPAGHPPVAPPTSTSTPGPTSPTSTTEPSPTTTTTPQSTRPPTSAASSSTTSPSSTSTPPSTTGYVPHAAGPPSTAAPPSSTSPPGSTAPGTRPPGSTAPGTRPPTTRPPTTTTPPTTTPPTTRTPPTTTGPPGGGQQPAPGPQPPSGQQPASHRVAEGDNLWTISRDHLATVTHRRASDLSDHEIATYWLRVIAVNRSSLRSGNPDLIFPGELIMLPPLSGGS